MRHNGQGQIIRCLLEIIYALCIELVIDDDAGREQFPVYPRPLFLRWGGGTHAAEDPKFFHKKMLRANHWYIIL